MTILVIFFCILDQIRVVLAVETAWLATIGESAIAFLSVVIFNEISFVGHQSNHNVEIREFSNFMKPIS